MAKHPEMTEWPEWLREADTKDAVVEIKNGYWYDGVWYDGERLSKRSAKYWHAKTGAVDRQRRTRKGELNTTGPKPQNCSTRCTFNVRSRATKRGY